ncbi:MAG TPA: hypothetical protein VL866_20820 [Pyrinomonadaceae bacterium]|nr:hypothetical protein [Pyrinomonadaceae bacterium]
MIHRRIEWQCFKRARLWSLPRIIGSTLFAGATGIGTGAFALMFVEGTILRLAVGGLISTSVTALVLLLILPTLRSELIQTLTYAYPRVATLESPSNS